MLNGKTWWRRWVTRLRKVLKIWDFCPPFEESVGRSLPVFSFNALLPVRLFYGPKYLLVEKDAKFGYLSSSPLSPSRFTRRAFGRSYLATVDSRTIIYESLRWLKFQSWRLFRPLDFVFCWCWCWWSWCPRVTQVSQNVPRTTLALGGQHCPRCCWRSFSSFQ